MNTVRLGWFKDVIGWNDNKKPERPKYPAMPVEEGCEVPSRSEPVDSKQASSTQSKANPLGLSNSGSSTPSAEKKSVEKQGANSTPKSSGGSSSGSGTSSNVGSGTSSNGNNVSS